MPWNDNQDGPWGGPKGNNGGSNPNNGMNQWNNPSGGNIDDIIKEDDKLEECEEFLKRNYMLMQLNEVDISTSAKTKILDKIRVYAVVYNIICN